ncbi:DNA repair protein RecO [Dyella sp.]|uniref:DNA repair protein RecO n=1 Tax=Dyella sp. TaxID=1869338 RepID=UPI002D7863E1|nr:DNA repair protein RecO [Dyella sp.]HET6431482.1 DNA repair protein RecO [Dyella sp.]
MRIDQQPGYVLHARPYRETSLLLECLTRDHGRIGVVARGARSGKGQLQRAQLEPFQPLLFDLLLRGELATLRTAEPAAAPARLIGDAGLAGLYLNELVVKLTGRQDPQPEVFASYADALSRLARGEPMAWTLRRFERDFLQSLGYALVLTHDIDGEPVIASEAYAYRAERGPVRAAVRQAGTIDGASLLALAEDRPPDAAGLQALRAMMRETIRFHLGGGELRSWQVLGAALARR